MKPFLVLLLCLFMPFKLLATEIALFVPNLDTPFWHLEIKFAQAAADDLGVTLQVFNAENQSQRMVQQVLDACEQGVDGILFMNYEQNGESILAITERYDIPSILYNTGFMTNDLLPRTKYKSWIGAILPDDKRLGALLAEQLLQRAYDNNIEQINLFVVNGNLKEVSTQQRNQGLYQFINYDPKVRVVAETDAGKGWSRSESKRLFIEKYQQHPSINVVWAASDNIALGIRDAMTELALPMDSIIVGGIDWLPDALDIVESIDSHITIGGHFTEAAWGIILLKDYLSNNDFVNESTQFHSQMHSINHQNIQMFQLFMEDNWARIDFKTLSKVHDGSKLYNFSIINLLDSYYQSSKVLQLTENEINWLHNHKSIKLAIDIDWPPFEYVNENRVYQGIAADYIKLIEERLGIEMVPTTEMTWPEVIEASKRRELDLYPALAITSERKKYLNFTRPYLRFPMMIITNQEIPFIGDIDVLNGQEVAVIKGYASQEMIQTTHPNIVQVEMENVTAALEAVSSGRVMAYIGNIATVNYVIQREGFTNLKVSGVTPYRFDLSMAVRSDWPILQTILQKALDSLSEGEKRTIYSRWVTLQYEHGFDYSLVWKVIVISLLVLVILSYWTNKLSNLNNTLSFEVAERKRIELQLRQEKKKNEKLAITDPLTGLFNRRHYIHVLPAEMNRIHRNNEWLSFVMIDLDCFKQYNDNYGHHNGDHVLVLVSSALQSLCHRSSDYCFRLGGEEFGVIFSGLDPNEAIAFTEKFRITIEELQIEHQFNSSKPVVTASFGLVISNTSKHTMEQLYESADNALYRAKEAGRNAIESVVLD
ncbi:diguanylate cyclase [Aliivibrio kagoshimensis]|uniref:diguanylate cyclase n=1 Tax=Aliivibrio kagoshimensis TaxID=2910230 RepID=UPI003D120CBF